MDRILRESCVFVIFAIYPRFLWEGWERYSFRGARPSGGALTISSQTTTPLLPQMSIPAALLVFASLACFLGAEAALVAAPPTAPYPDFLYERITKRVKVWNHASAHHPRLLDVPKPHLANRVRMNQVRRGAFRVDRRHRVHQVILRDGGRLHEVLKQRVAVQRAEKSQ